ncbi:hypothetical protein HHL16_15385 [Pseudoflavitalea sp. G-6-1-2]|uniref:WG repeat-containing protein n=1 Tax=Pseudoflavitalea sp. G-6-1-2 TaxID=2728841 RepID=UPI00146E3CC6|nr:WG repeat-containing protein [Pseudoflavitalea sp. G-6-1-2]NML22266.1 hypothetical protein [Pseudoflavitalea sp. G-6-1-2]
MKTIIVILLLCMNSISNAQYLIPYNQNGQFGLCNTEGELKLTPQYQSVGFFNKELNGYLIEKESRYGLLDKDLKPVIPAISIAPLASSGEWLVVFVSENEFHYYSKTTFQLVNKKTIGNQNNSGPVMPYDPNMANSPNFGWSREQVMLLFMEKHGNKSKEYHVVDATGYFQINEVEENGKGKPIGLFLARTKSFMLNNADSVRYISATWVPAKQTYYVIAKTGPEQYVTDANKAIVFPRKQYSRLYIMPEYIGFTADSIDNKKTANYYIINSGKVIENKFSDFRHTRTLTIDNRRFDIFSVTINNYYQHKSQRVLIGENGKPYFSVDFEYNN